MANGTLVIENGRVTRMNLVEPMVPGTRFTHRGLAFVVTGDGETAEPVSLAAAGARAWPSPAMGAALAVAGLLVLAWFFLRPTRG